VSCTRVIIIILRCVLYRRSQSRFRESSIIRYSPFYATYQLHKSKTYVPSMAKVIISNKFFMSLYSTEASQPVVMCTR